MRKYGTLTLSSMNRKKMRKKTRQERSKENSHPFCDGATKKLLQLNQYRYEADFRMWQVLDIYRALDMSEPISLKQRGSHWYMCII